MSDRCIAGAGMGLRIPHAATMLDNETDIPWVELLADNWLAEGGINRYLLDAITERYPCVLHGVCLSLGAIDPLDFAYLAKIKRLKQQTGAVWYSEHCSFSVHDGLQIPDLLPLPYTSEAVTHISSRIRQVQDFLGEQILLENVSSYLSQSQPEMSEGEFLAAVATETDCDLLLDINNAYVSEFNNQQSCVDLLSALPPERVRQIHLAGYENKGNFLLDAHNNPVSEPVWQHFKAYIAEHGAIPTMIEWDNDLPDFARLHQEQQRIQNILNKPDHGVQSCAT